jgi:plastocyanin
MVTAQPSGSLEIVMTGGAFNPKGPQVSAGYASFYLVNPSTSSAPHQMTILNASGRVLAASAQVAVETAALFTVRGMKPGSYEFYCAIDGHRAEGMTGILDVR